MPLCYAQGMKKLFFETVDAIDPLSLNGDQGWTRRVASDDTRAAPPKRFTEAVQAAPDTETDKQPIRVHQVVQSAIDAAWQAPHDHHEHHEAMILAQRITRAMVHELLPASALLYVPADEIAAITIELQHAAHHMVSDVRQTAKRHGDSAAFCRSTFEGELRKQLKHHMGGSTTVQSFTKRHDPKHHHPAYANKSAPETGMPTVASICSAHGGIIGCHGLTNHHH